jgi:hypothetical protein
MRKSIESDEGGEDGVCGRPRLIGFDEFPPGYPWARLLSSRAGLRFTRQVQFSAGRELSPAGPARGGSGFSGSE